MDTKSRFTASFPDEFSLASENGFMSFDFSKSLPSWLSYTPQKSNKINPLTLQGFTEKYFEADPENKKVKKPITKPQLTIGGLISRYILKKQSFPFIPTSWLPIDTHKKPVDMRVFLKSPYVVAGDDLQGTITIKYHLPSSIEEFIYTIKYIKVTFVGIEAVKDTLKSEDRFLSLPVIELLKTDDILSFYTKTSSTETKHLAIPFSIPLPNDLSGTYISKKGSITYQIRSNLEYLKQNSIQDSVQSNESVTVYANYALNNTLLHLDSAISCTATYGSLDIKANLLQSTWTSDAPFFATAQIQDSSTINNNIQKIKARILRSQYFYSSRDYTRPAVLRTKVIAQTSSSEEAAWLKSLNTVSNELVPIMLYIPDSAATVSNCKLIQVSYSLEILLSCSKKGPLEEVIKVPITIVHPISMSQYVGKYKKQPNLIKCLQSISLIQQETRCESLYSGYSTDGTFSPLPSEIDSESELEGKNRTKSLKKSISEWGSRLSKILLLSSNSLKLPSTTKSHKSIECGSKKSIIRFGCVPGPKQYGHNPGCLRDTETDIKIHRSERVINSHALAQ